MNTDMDLRWSRFSHADNGCSSSGALAASTLLPERLGCTWGIFESKIYGSIVIHVDRLKLFGPSLKQLEFILLKCKTDSLCGKKSVLLIRNGAFWSFPFFYFRTEMPVTPGSCHVTLKCYKWWNHPYQGICCAKSWDFFNHNYLQVMDVSSVVRTEHQKWIAFQSFSNTT